MHTPRIYQKIKKKHSSLYAREEYGELQLKKFLKWRSSILILILILVITVILTTVIGPVQISPLIATKILISKLPVSGIIFTKTWSSIEETIILEIRLPRIILGILVGASLAVAGATMQGLFKNPMADPFIIGISSGAALSVSLIIISGIDLGLGMFTLPIGAFLGASLAAFLVYNIAKVDGRVPIATLLLSGIAIAAFLSALTSFVMYMAGESLHQIVFWLMGGLSGRGWNHVFMIFLPVIAGTAVLFLFARDLNLMLLGEEPAQHLGIEVEKIKKIILLLASLLTGVAVSVGGIIGFVGLIIPHIMRTLVGPDHRILLPASALVGGIFLVWTDTLARSIIAPTEIPVGIITTFFGAPFFLYLLRVKKSSFG